MNTNTRSIAATSVAALILVVCTPAASSVTAAILLVHPSGSAYPEGFAGPTTTETLTLGRRMRIRACGGTARLGG